MLNLSHRDMSVLRSIPSQNRRLHGRSLHPTCATLRPVLGSFPEHFRSGRSTKYSLTYLTGPTNDAKAICTISSSSECVSPVFRFLRSSGSRLTARSLPHEPRNREATKRQPDRQFRE